MSKKELRKKVSGSNRKAITVFSIIALALIVAVGIIAAIALSSEPGNKEVVSKDKEAVVQVEESAEKEEAVQAEAEVTEEAEVFEEVVVASDDAEELDYAAVFIVSINPKVKIYVDAEGIVLKMEKMNDDAEELLAEINWANKKLEDCFNALLVKAHEKGYLNDNAKVSIEVAESKNDAVVSEMTEEMETVAEETCKDMNVDITLTLKSDDAEETMEKEIKGTTTENTILPTDTTQEQANAEDKTEVSKPQSGSSSNTGSGSGSSGNKPSKPPVVQNEYKLVWEDNFDGEKLSDDWNVELRNPGWVNKELQAYVNSEDNIYLEDGNLVLRPIKHVAEDGSISYTSGRVNTQNKKNFKYGKFEARAKVPTGTGYLPAFWLMAADENLYGQWPRCGEIDIMEVLGDKTDTLHGTIHYGHSTDGHKSSQGTYTLDSGTFADEFHTFTCEWEPGKITWYVDGIKYHEENDWYTAMSDGNGEVTYPAPFDQEFYIILNLAVGGEWPGNPDESTDFVNQTYEIDYVRVYQKDSYDENVTRPEKEEIVLRNPDANGNYLLNGDFEIIEDLTEAVNWQFKEAEGGVGSTIIATEKDGVMAISGNSAIVETTKCGNKAHSIQLMQNDVPLKAGATYELSFDAYAMAEREMRVNSKAPDRNWYPYLDELITLTTEKKTYSYEFNMIHPDDANCTVEFNMGALGATDTIVIDNVSLKIVDEDEELRESILNPDKAVRADGNYIYNGEFQEGEGRLGYWDVSSGANVSVTSLEDGRRLKVVVPANGSVTISQKNVPVIATEEYILSLDAEIPSSGNIVVNFDGADYTVVTGDNGYWEQKFAVSDGTERRDITITFNGEGTYYLDNVRIDEPALIKNGSFNAGFAGYNHYVHDEANATYNVDSITYDNVAAYDIEKTGSQAYMIQLKQEGVDLEKDQWYKLSLEAMSTIDRKLMFAIQRDGLEHKNAEGGEDWTPYSGEKIVDLTNDWQTFELSFQMTEETDLDSILSISMGAVANKVITEKHSVYIDNILLEKTDAPKADDVVAGENMLINPEFSGEGEPWERILSAPAIGEITFGDGAITYALTAVGTEDYHAQLKQMGLKLEEGETYKVSFKAKSTEARTIKASVMSAKYAWYNGKDTVLEKDVAQDISFEVEMKVDDANAGLFISLGKIENKDTPASTITLSDFSVVKLGEQEPDGGEEAPTYSDNMFVNGNFAEASPWTYWTAYASGDDASASATSNYENEQFTVVISNEGSKAHGVQLKYEPKLELEKGATYKYAFDVTSTVARGVVSQLQDSTYVPIGWKKSDLAASETTHVEYEFTYEKENSSDYTFCINMGKLDGADAIDAEHTITFDNFSLVKVVAQEPNTGEGTPDNGSGTPSSPGLPANSMFVNGNFAEASPWTYWTAYASGDDASASATSNYENEQFTVVISNEGSKAHGVQLKYEPKLELEKGATYKYAFDVTSTVARGVVSQLQDSTYVPIGWKKSDLAASETTHVEYEFTYEKENSSDYTFCINMGKMDGADAIGAAHTITFDNFSLVKVSSAPQEAAVLTLRTVIEDALEDGADEILEEATEEDALEEDIPEEETEEEAEEEPTQEALGEEAIIETKSEEEDDVEVQE